MARKILEEIKEILKSVRDLEKRLMSILSELELDTNEKSELSLDSNVIEDLDDSKLLVLLKNKRSKLATEQKVHENQIFSDQELKLLSSVKPTDNETFLKIKGIRAVNSKKYVQHFLPIIRNFLGLTGKIIIRFEEEPKTNSRNRTNNEEKLYQSLKDLRARISREEKSPAYMIFHDSTLNDIVMFKPKTRDDLFNIKGLGISKIDWFGHEILELVEKFFGEEL